MGGFEMRTGETISPNKRRAKLSNIQLLCKMQMSNQIKYPKDILKCADCNYRVRTTGWHWSKVADKKRI